MSHGHNEGGGLARRDFVKLCFTAMAVSAKGGAFAKTDDGVVRTYKRSLLVDTDNQPIRPSDLEVGENYIFHYPHITTPCFLLNLGEPINTRPTLKTEDGREYQWQGGVGPGRSIVAYSAICAHKMTHPAKAVSFINYRHERVKFQDKRKKEQEGSHIIYCCSEKSVYDVTKGAKVLGGPAKQPLAAIALEYDDAMDAVYATGTYGGEMFSKFFKTFITRLQLEYRVTDVNRLVAKHTRVLPLDEYCNNQILC